MCTSEWTGHCAQIYVSDGGSLSVPLRYGGQSSVVLRSFPLICIKVWWAPDASFRFFSLRPLQKSENQQIKNGASARLRYKSQKWDVRKSSFFEGHEVGLNFRDAATSGTNHRNVLPQPGISDFPKLSVTALLWWAKGRRPLGPPKLRSVNVC